MKKLISSFVASFFLSFFSSYGQTIPIIEIRIKNTATSKDDYVNSAYSRCDIRLVNGSSFSTNIPLVLRNVSESGGRVSFSATGGSSAASSTLSLTVSRTNSPTTFYIRGAVNSVRDKDAVIEVLDNRSSSNPAVLARQALMVTSSSPVPNSLPQIEMQINSVSTLDDYVTWSPTSCSIRLVNYQSFSSPVNISLRNFSAASGNVNFASSTLAYNSTATNTTLNITLPNTGTWVNFFIAGRFGRPSLRDKDAIIEIIKAGTQTFGSTVVPDGLLLGREALMVRVRKNGNSISTVERQRFLNALTTLNNTFNGYQVLNDIHIEAANPEAHLGPGFLAWHRAYILSFERKIQSVDPGATLPYWRFDLAAPNVFSLDFMGSKPTVSSDTFADFNASDPLIAWNITGGPGIRRTTAFANNAAPSTVKSNWLSETATLALGNTYAAFRALENNPHNYAHIFTASRSGDWLSVIGTSVRDPLFFLLHCNVDRVWARWQWLNNRFDAASSQSYSPLGSFPNSGSIHIGHYVNDTMWPWNGITGTYTGTGTVLIGNRPTTAPGGALQTALSLSAPVSVPRPFNMIDYRNNRLISTVNSGMGFCYDDVPFN